jgi:DNA topoisomerase III
MNGKFDQPRNGKSNDQSHPPIHPTKNVTNLSGVKKTLYEMIVRHFLACCSEDAHGFETTVTIEIAGELFSDSGLMVVERNFLDIYPYQKWSDKTLPVFAENERFMPTAINLHHGMTEPPQLLTEAELIDLMDKNGIGV